MEEAAKTAKQSAESVSKGGEKLGRTAAFKALSQVSWAGLLPAGTLGPGLLPAPGSRVAISGLSPSQLCGLGQITAPRELLVNRPRASSPQSVADTLRSGPEPRDCHSQSLEVLNSFCEDLTAHGALCWLQGHRREGLSCCSQRIAGQGRGRQF